MQEPMFIIKRTGLVVSFINKSRIPAGSTASWDFGDSTEPLEAKDATHTYEAEGFYEVTLSITSQAGDKSSASMSISVTDKVSTTLTGSIYTLIDGYLPDFVAKGFTFQRKVEYIEKWQLFMQPLVNREIPIEEFNNEFYYEALENRLIMEAAMLDYLSLAIAKLLHTSAADSGINTGGSTEGGSEGDVKKIITGPSEVEFFDSSSNRSDVIAQANRAAAPGGILDMMRKNLCSLASRLDISLPFCQRPVQRVVPLNAPVDKSDPLRGPNPSIITR